MRLLHKKLFFSLALTFLLAEVALRIGAQVRPSILAYSPDRYRRFKARPGDLSYGFPINRDGFKDQPFLRQRAPGEYRVAALGDSFVFGMVPHEATICTVLEKKFPNVNVMNFGVIATKPEDYLAVLRQDALPYAPDSVMTFLYVGNDFLPSRRKGYEYSALATFLYHSIRAIRAYQGQDIRQNYTYDDDMTPFSYAEFVDTEARYAETYTWEADRFEKEFQRTMRSLDAMRDLCAEHRIPFRVVVLPDRLQIEPDLQNDVARRLPRPLSSFDFLRPQRRLSEALAAREIPYVDLYEPFARDHEKKFINHDLHFNIYGNRLVAEQLPDDWFRKD